MGNLASGHLEGLLSGFNAELVLGRKTTVSARNFMCFTDVDIEW